jgi:hypothetical protein
MKDIGDVPAYSLGRILDYLKGEERHYQGAALKNRPGHIWMDVVNVREWLDSYNSQEEDAE